MSHFRLLSDPENYAVQDWDLTADAEGRDYWLGHFSTHMDQVLDAAAGQYGRGARKRIELARTAFAEDLARLRENPASLTDGRLRLIDLCILREKALRANGLGDPFFQVKRRENDAALQLYPAVIERLETQAAEDRWLDLFACVFAGNIFDLGSAATMKYAEEMDFYKAIEELPPRPWHLDDYDSLAERLPIDGGAGWTKAVIFVDNAGADFVLGMVPLARELALAGVQIVLAANERPALNDITIDEAIELVRQLALIDEDLNDLIGAEMFELVSSGNDMPLIDLSDVSDELNAAAEEAELVVLEGMGRSVESNFDTPFDCDVLRLCLLKDEAVARRIGGKLFDVVCKFTPAPTDPEA